MRNLFLLLVLLNLGAWAFFGWVITEPETSPIYEGPGITLLRELDPDAPISRSDSRVNQAEQIGDFRAVGSGADSAGAAATETLTSVQAADSVDDAGEAQFGRCISIGPFPEETEADLAMGTLAGAGFEPTRSVREADVWDGYWVFIEQIESLASARTIQADLADNGVEDTQIVSGSERGTLLSLGVFSEITRAGLQAERINQIGYEATIADNMATTETYWLEVMLSNEQGISLDALQAPGQISRLELLPCADGESD